MADPKKYPKVPLPFQSGGRAGPGRRNAFRQIYSVTLRAHAPGGDDRIWIYISQKSNIAPRTSSENSATISNFSFVKAQAIRNSSNVLRYRVRISLLRCHCVIYIDVH